MRKALILTLILLVISSGSLAAVASAAPSSNNSVYTTQVNVPFNVYTGQGFFMYVNSTYGFTNYTVTVYFSGDNLTGFAPSNTFHNFSASNPDFVLEVTAPNVKQQMTFMVKTTADSSSGAKSFVSTYKINVIPPIYLHAAVTNKNTVSLYNVTVNFYVDNTYVASRTITTIGAGQTQNLNYTWLAPYISNGEHTLEVQVNNTMLSINGGGNSVTTHFYYGNPPNYNWIYYIVAVVAIFMLVLAMGSGRRPKVGERRPKWRDTKK